MSGCRNLRKRLYFVYFLTVGQGDYGTVDPGNEDELSDFGSVTEIPLNGGDSSPLKVAAERKMLRENVDEAIHSTG